MEIKVKVCNRCGKPIEKEGSDEPGSPVTETTATLATTTTLGIINGVSAGTGGLAAFGTAVSLPFAAVGAGVGLALGAIYLAAKGVYYHFKEDLCPDCQKEVLAYTERMRRAADALKQLEAEGKLEGFLNQFEDKGTIPPTAK